MQNIFILACSLKIQIHRFIRDRASIETRKEKQKIYHYIYKLRVGVKKGKFLWARVYVKSFIVTFFVSPFHR